VSTALGRASEGLWTGLLSRHQAAQSILLAAAPHPMFAFTEAVAGVR